MVTDTLVTRLHQGGILAALTKMGMDQAEFVEQLSTSGHHYDRYRWSVALGEDFCEVIHAMPPEEEVGWTPWERWVCDADGLPTHQSWAVSAGGAGGSPVWLTVDDHHSTDLSPLFASPTGGLSTRLALSRVVHAFSKLGIDGNDLIAELGPDAARRYALCRWVVVPHFLADHGPVVYSIPPLTDSARWPWETWYKADGHQIHHAHFRGPKPGCTREWFEPIGAPQRPPEVLGQTWFWGDVQSMAPMMSTT